MKEKVYKLTKEQLETIDYTKRMIQLHKETIENLCNNEKDDIKYGYELGLINANLSQIHTDLLFLLDDVKKQTL